MTCPAAIQLPQGFAICKQISSPLPHQGRWTENTTKSTSKIADHAPRVTRRCPSSSSRPYDPRWIAALPSPSTEWSNNNKDIQGPKNNSFHSPVRPRRCLELKWDAVVDKTPALSPKKPGRSLSSEKNGDKNHSTTVWSDNNNNNNNKDTEGTKNNSFHSPMRPRRCLELRWDALVDKTTAMSPKKPGRSTNIKERCDSFSGASEKPPVIRQRAGHSC